MAATHLSDGLGQTTVSETPTRGHRKTGRGSNLKEARNVMSTLLPLSSMTIEDKLLAMESLGDDICRLRPAMEPPAWHRDILDERERNLQEGSDELLDWEEGKRAIRERIA